jgi:hypothetical protein
MRLLGENIQAPTRDFSRYQGSRWPDPLAM